MSRRDNANAAVAGDVASDDCEEARVSTDGDATAEPQPPYNYAVPQPQFTRGQYMFRGQGSPNPCCCFSGMCNGTCSLCTGCIVIAIIFIVLGSISLANSVPPLLGPLTHLFTLVAEHATEKRHDRRWRALRNYSGTEDHSSKDYKEIFAATRHIDIVTAIDGAFFLTLPGILLLIACFRINRIICFVFMTLVAAGISYDLGGTIYLTVKVSQLRLLRPNSKLVDELKYAVLIYIWVMLFFLICFKSYGIICTFCLTMQIKAGEYEPSPSPYLIRYSYPAGWRTNPPQYDAGRAVGDAN